MESRVLKMTVTSRVMPRFGHLYQVKLRDYAPEPIPRKPGSEGVAEHYVQYKPMSPEQVKLLNLGKTRLSQAFHGQGIETEVLQLDLVATHPFMHTFQQRLGQLMQNIRDVLPAPNRQHVIEESPVLKRLMQIRRLESQAQLDTLLETQLNPYPVYVAPKGICSVEFSVPSAIKVGKTIISAPSELVEALGTIAQPNLLLTRQPPSQN